MVKGSGERCGGWLRLRLGLRFRLSTSLPRPLRLDLRGVLRRDSSELELPPLRLAEQLVVQGRDTLDLRAQLINLHLDIYMDTSSTGRDCLMYGVALYLGLQAGH